LRGFNRFRYAILPILLVLFLLPALPSFGSVEAQTATSSPSTVASLAGPPIQFTETSDYIRLNSTLFTVEFYKGTAGYNIIYDKLGNVLVYNDRIVLEYWTGKQWKQRGTPTGISWVEIDDYWYNVTRHYTDYLGTEYNITYMVRSDTSIKIAISLKSGQTDTYRLAWHPSGITKLSYSYDEAVFEKTGSLTKYRVVFGEKSIDYEWIGFDWSDVIYSFGNITEVTVEDVANGKKANIYFNIGKIKAGETVEIDPSIVGTSTAVTATAYGFQRKAFYADGLFWVFYSDGTNMVYRTSSDGSSWSAATAVRSAANGRMFSIWFDGTYLHYAYCGDFTALYYRRGSPNSDGTITWSAPEQTVSTSYNQAHYPFVSVDTNGYVWIGYCDYTGSAYVPYVIKSSTTDGTWTTASGFPYQLSTSSDYWRVSPIPITNGKMVVIYAGQYITVRARRWDGSSWGAERQTASAIYFELYYSAVAQGDDVHLVFLKDVTYDIVYVKYSYASDSFGSEKTIIAGATDYSSPVLSLTNNGVLYCFWATKTTGTPSGATANHIYYQTSSDGGSTWSNPVDWIDESSEVLSSANRLTCFYKQYGDYIGLLYMTKTSSPYNMKFAYIFNHPPNAPILDTPAINVRFDPSASVTFTWTFSDPDTGDSQSAFQFQLDDNSDFSSPIIDTGKVSSGTLSTTQSLPNTVGLYYWRVKTWDSSDAEGAWSSGRAIIVDRVQITLSVSDSRIDVGETMSWSYTATYSYDGADATPYITVTLNDTTTKTSVGKWAFTVSSITESQYGLTVFDANTVECIWDRVQITLTPDDTRINVGSTGSYSFTATYEYDGADVSSFITINLNDTLTKSAVGKYGYTVSSITESQYGLTGFTSNSFYIIFDKLMVTLSIADSRINVGDTASISYTVTRQYDDSVSDATVTLNDTLTKNTVGKWAFTAESVSGDEYGITVFDSNIVTCIWDRVNINVFQVADPSIKVGEEAQFVVGGVYEYDGTVWSGTYTLNDTLTHSNIGKYVYRIASITDSIYGLTAFNQTAPDVYVLVGFNSLSLYQTNEQYKSEGKPYIQNTTDIITSLSYSPAKLTFNVDEIAEGEASITIVKGIGKAPQNLYIDGLTAPSKNTRDEFDSYGAKCWYYDSTNDLIYVKTYGSKIEILWKGYTPPPPSPPGGVPSAPPAMYGLVVTVTSMGEPAPDLKVEVYSDSRLVASGTTNANGIYSVSLNPGTYTVVVYLDGEKITETVTLDKTKTLSITVPAAPTIEITGFIQLAALLTVILIILTVAARFIRKE